MQDAHALGGVFTGQSGVTEGTTTHEHRDVVADAVVDLDTLSPGVVDGEGAVVEVDAAGLQQGGAVAQGDRVAHQHGETGVVQRVAEGERPAADAAEVDVTAEAAEKGGIVTLNTGDEGGRGG